MKYRSVKTRNRLLFLASRLERWAKQLRQYVKATTPPRRKRGAVVALPSGYQERQRQADLVDRRSAS